jgi:methylenetetrahydrofolate dehydrogenase (NADP+)/methenyltetrahydrofolate cyclohydrolase
VGERIHGQAVAERVEIEVRERASVLRAAGVQVGLAMVQVGDHEPSRIYVRRKQVACERAGIRSYVEQLPADTSQADLLRVIDGLNQNPEVHGVLVQLPLPAAISENAVLFAIDPWKDVDGFHYINAGHLATDKSGLRPCTPKGVMRLLSEHGVALRGLHAVVLGRSRVVGRPMAAMLLAADATVTVCHRYTPDSAHFSRQADVVVAAMGKPGTVTASWIKEAAVVIDVGLTRGPDGQIRGDVDFDGVLPKARLVSPVPGGVGPMTIAMLLDNTCEAAERLTAGRSTTRVRASEDT